MKKIFIFAAAAMVMATACNKNTTPVAGAIPSDGNDGPVAIKFGTNVHTDATKSPVEAWNAQTLYVFGYARTTFSDATPSDLTNAYIDGVAATAPASGTKGAINVLDADGLPFYYAYANNTYTAYDFYGCYFADAADAANIVKEETKISVPFVIDGTQDLMVAAADRAADIAVEGSEIDNVNYAYSGYSARKGVTPNLLFKHCLTRFDISIQNCSTTETVINLDSLKLSSIAAGSLVIATIAEGDSTGVVTEVGAEVKDLAIENMAAEGVELKPDDPATELGSIMVIPAEQHVIKLFFKQLIDKDVPGVYKEGCYADHTIDPENVADEEGNPIGVTKFEVGKKYNVLVKVYGLEKVEITVELAPWVDGGSIVIDPDDNPFNE